MGLFGKKDPCPICGNAVKGLFPTKVEGQALCKECGSVIDLPDGALSHMTLSDLRRYMAFRQENEALRSQFQPTQEVKLGWLGDKFYFDMPNRLMCKDETDWRTIFEGKQIKSFTIREDTSVIFEGSADGLKCYTSNVPQRVDALMPVIAQAKMMEEMERAAEQRGEKRTHYYNDIPEPFEKFYVEIHFDHPYWNVMTITKNAPTFNNSNPSSTTYLREYNESFMALDQLAHALKEVAFPGASELRLGQFGMGQVVIAQTATAAAAPAASADVVAEIQRFKTLVEQGILTEEEFAAKKRQLLGI